MTSLLHARKRAEEFDALVSGARPTDATPTELLELSGVATVLREHTPVAPRADFAADLRERLMLEAQTVLSRDSRGLALPVRRPGARERRLVAAATALVFVGGSAGMAAASQNALPGDPLYPIKRGIERAEASLNTNDADKGLDLLSQAGARLAEARSLIEQDGASTPEVPATIEAFSAQAEEGSVLLMSAFQESRDPDTIAAVRSFAADSLTSLQELAKTAGPQAQVKLADAGELLQSLDQQAVALCASCADLPPLKIDLLLQSATATRSVQHTKTQKAQQTSTKTKSRTSTPSRTTTEAPAPVVESPSVTTDTVKGTVTDTQKTTEKTLSDTTDKLGKLLEGATDTGTGLLNDVISGTDTSTDGIGGLLP